MACNRSFSVQLSTLVVSLALCYVLLVHTVRAEVNSNGTSTISDTTMGNFIDNTTDEVTNSSDTSTVSTVGYSSLPTNMSTDEECNSTDTAPRNTQDTNSTSISVPSPTTDGYTTKEDNNTVDNTTTVTIAPTTAAPAKINETCSQTINCTAGLTCISYLCDCKDTQYYNESNTENVCPAQQSFGQPCSKPAECIDNLSCISGTCNCTDSQYYENSNSGALCRPKQPVNATCSQNDQCSADLTCNLNICSCANTEYYDGSNAADLCRPKKSIGQSCSKPAECIDNLSCINGTCNCTDSQYYDTITTRALCRPKKSIGQSCSNFAECIVNLSCINGTCNCTDSQYYDNITTGALCRPKISYGNSCAGTSAIDVCEGPNTACTPPASSNTTKLCLCATGYYRSDSQTCVSRNNLKISLPNVTRQTTTIAFSWMDKSDRNNVNYTITWNNTSVTATKSGGNATGLTPGTQYTFVIYSTLNSDANYQSIVELSNYTNWTYPAKPGNVTQVSETPQELIYKITFENSDGNVASYRMDISGITNSATTNSSSVTFPLQAATAYYYTLVAYNGNSDPSELRTGTFTTPPKASGPVLGLNVTDYSEVKANITWKTPSFPNGNITGYLVQVLIYETQICLYYITHPCYNCDQSKPPNVTDTNCTSLTETAKNTYDSSTGYYHLELPKLKPYHNYTVTVRAVNERGNGRPSNTTFRTDIAVANSPFNLTLDSAINESSWWINININWIPGDYTGPTTYYILVQKGADPDSNNFSSSNEYNVSDYYTNTHVLYDVQANWNYKISVKAKTDKGNSSSMVEPIKTAANRPGLVQDLTLIQDTRIAKKINVSFLCPVEQDRNGTIERFVIRQTLLGPDNETVVTRLNYSYPADSTTSCKGNSIFINESNILVEKRYSFAVMAINNKYEGNFGNSSVIYINPKVPRLEENFGDRLVSKPNSITNQTTIHVDVCASCLTNNSQGDVTNVGLVVCVKGPQCEFQGRKKRSTVTSEDFGQLLTWKKAKMTDFTTGYRATPDNWIQTLNSSGQPNSFTIGTNTSCLDFNETVYCNGPLPSGKKFQITVIVCTSAGCDTYTSKIDFVTQEQVFPPSNDNVGAIVGGVIGGLAFIIIVCIIILFIWRRKSKGKPPRRSNIFREMDERSKEIKLKRPVGMRHFNEHIVKFHKDSNLLFQDEFESIQNLAKTFNSTCNEAQREQNRVKNRYVDILPFDHSRVKLDLLPDDDETNDFINANYIPGYNSVREYIATQGAMFCTIPDFWKMAWQQKVKVIVMLSDLMEGGKRKVDLYWPENLNEPINYGHVVVEMTNFSQLNNYIIRNFKVTKGEEVRRMTHFFLPGWSDFSADVGFDVVLGFVKLMRQEATPANPGPIIVHCSAGVGRTGTLIALDYFTQFVEKHSLDDEIDIFDFVMQMRRQRSRMVQVESQYIFIYDAVNKIIQQKIKAEEERLYENTSSNGVYANMLQKEENIYANTDIKEDKYVYNNEAFEPDFSSSDKNKNSDKPTTEL